MQTDNQNIQNALSSLNTQITHAQASGDEANLLHNDQLKYYQDLQGNSGDKTVLNNFINTAIANNNNEAIRASHMEGAGDGNGLHGNAQFNRDTSSDISNFLDNLPSSDNSIDVSDQNKLRQLMDSNLPAAITQNSQNSTRDEQDGLTNWPNQDNNLKDNIEQLNTALQNQGEKADSYIQDAELDRKQAAAYRKDMWQDEENIEKQIAEHDKNVTPNSENTILTKTFDAAINDAQNEALRASRMEGSGDGEHLHGNAVFNQDTSSNITNFLNALPASDKQHFTGSDALDYQDLEHLKNASLPTTINDDTHISQTFAENAHNWIRQNSDLLKNPLKNFSILSNNISQESNLAGEYIQDAELDRKQAAAYRKEMWFDEENIENSLNQNHNGGSHHNQPSPPLTVINPIIKRTEMINTLHSTYSEQKRLIAPLKIIKQALIRVSQNTLRHMV